LLFRHSGKPPIGVRGRQQAPQSRIFKSINTLDSSFNQSDDYFDILNFFRKILTIEDVTPKRLVLRKGESFLIKEIDSYGFIS
jgi:hypothetical protein